MRHVIPLSRAGLEQLVKRLPRAGGAHKYIKRERYFKNGKPAWRYFYKDDDQRTRHRETADTEHAGQHVEHYLQTDMTMVYDSLKKELPPTRDWTEERLSQQMVTRPRVKMSTGFQKKFKLPAVEEEEHGRGPERNVTQRIAMALGMLPEKLQNLADIRQIEMLDGRDPKLLAHAKETGEPIPASSMESLSGGGSKLTFVAETGAGGINSAPHGSPHFGSALTLTEERVWHQVGRAIIANGENNKRLARALREFRDLSKSASSRDEVVSAFAARSWQADFAESLACLLSHPKQLAEQAPDRYNWLMKNGFGNENIAKEADALLDAPQSDFAWYLARKQTKNKKVLDKLKESSPAGVPFRSEKDQFYAMSVEGRTLYFRIGPPDAASEPGWDRMPETVDPDTGLPVWDSEAGNAFRGVEQYKEVYDEHGNRLDGVSGFFYLMQGVGDPKWEAKLPATLPDDPGKLRAHAIGSAREWTLGRKIFKTFGESRAYTSAEKAKEKKAVEKYTKEGKLDEKRGDRWKWVPHSISKEEFHAKTPTFGFDGIREAAEQPHVIKGQTDHDSRGRPVPKLSAKVYELLTVDGTGVRLTVQESPSFTNNQQIHAPVVIEKLDPETGNISRTLEWADVTLSVAGPGDEPGFDQTTGVLTVQSLDPKDISKDLKVSQSVLLKRNGKFQQHQLHDPVLANLINPNNRAIRSASDLMGLIREAANAGNEAWVSVQFDSEVPSHSLHAKVKFDGAGSPLLLGDYWKRKLGMENPRISDLVSAGNSIKMQKPRRRKARAPKINIGDIVRFTVKGEEFFGRLLDRSLKGKRSYKIAPLPGQETPPGWDRMPDTVSTGRALSVPSDRDPERPNIRKREYVAPDNDLLLFADDILTRSVTREVKTRGGKTRTVEAREEVPASGVVKIALPKDGSWSLEEMAAAPGVSTNPKGELFLDIRMIDRFRDHVGGFVMDDAVQQKLRMMMEISKAEGGSRPHTVSTHDIADPLNGNKVRADGLLKGVREFIGNNPFTLGKHQVELLQAIADQGGRQLAAHFMGTGKTVSAIAAVKMMQNLTTPDGSPHPNRPKRVIVVVPKNTSDQWEGEVARFTYGKATVVGSTSTTNALQMWSPPEELSRKIIKVRGEQRIETWEEFLGRKKMTREAYEAEVEQLRVEALEANPHLWRPEEDESDIIIVPQEYFTQHADELKRIGGFDGMIVDEAHGIQRPNRRSDQIVDYWNEDMKMMLLLSGTPITNRLNTLPRYIELLSKGEILLGGDGTTKEQRENFESWAMTASSVMKSLGEKKGALMDLNPQAIGRLMELLKPYIHVATSGDVVDKTMPAVLLDENSPVPQTPIQASLYRGYMNQLTEEDRRLFELSSTLGEDENILSAGAQRKLNHARMITNTPGYKPPDGREYITITIPDEKAYRDKVRTARKEARDADRNPDTAADKILPEKFTKTIEYRLPEMKQIENLAKGFWPSSAQLQAIFPHQEQRQAFKQWVGYAIGKEYETQLEGKAITTTTSEDQRKAMKSGEPLNGMVFGKKVSNPDYGPEGVIARGAYDEKTQSAKEIRYKIRDASGRVVDEVVVPVGLRFIRDPRQRNKGYYFMAGLPSDHPDAAKFESDWDFSKAMVEEGAGEGTVKGAEKGQVPIEGKEAFNIQTHPARRRERLMFDLAMTTGNAKTDEMERYMAAKFDPKLGGNPDKQMIVFAEAIGSGVRCIESKLRMQGYQDVNEALNADDSTALVPPNGKYFVTYLGTGGTLGDRDVNSEIFKKRKNEDGSDSEMSMFVHRTLHGVTGNPRPGEVTEGWRSKQRADIRKLFPGVTPPTRTMQDAVSGEFKYFYEEDLKASEKRRFATLEVNLLRARGSDKADAESKMREFLAEHWTTKSPLTERHVQVFNNCQMMVASDAAQVGLNWGNATDLIMYDSLFSPMEEWQRITRAARMLPPAVRDKFKKHFAKLGSVVESMESETGLQEFDGDVNGALAIVTQALDKVPDIRDALMKAGQNPETTAESFLAQRALDRIRKLRPEVEQRLRTEGRTLKNAPKKPLVAALDQGEAPSEGVDQYIPKQEITSADITNEILEGSGPDGKPYLSAFEKTILRSRKYLVDVKRLTTSVVSPTKKEVTRKVKNPETGKMETIKYEVVTGEQVEFPTAAERSKLLQARAKQVPFESLLNDLQSELPTHTSYDFETASPGQLAKFEPAPKKTAEELAAQEARTAKREAFYGRDESGLTLRQRELAERRRISKERKAARAAARKARVKKSMSYGPLGYL